MAVGTEPFQKGDKVLARYTHPGSGEEEWCPGEIYSTPTPLQTTDIEVLFYEEGAYVYELFEISDIDYLDNEDITIKFAEAFAGAPEMNPTDQEICTGTCQGGACNLVHDPYACVFKGCPCHKAGARFTPEQLVNHNTRGHPHPSKAAQEAIQARTHAQICQCCQHAKMAGADHDECNGQGTIPNLIGGEVEFEYGYEAATAYEELKKRHSLGEVGKVASQYSDAVLSKNDPCTIRRPAINARERNMLAQVMQVWMENCSENILSAGDHKVKMAAANFKAATCLLPRILFWSKESFKLTIGQAGNEVIKEEPHKRIQRLHRGGVQGLADEYWGHEQRTGDEAIERAKANIERNGGNNLNSEVTA